MRSSRSLSCVTVVVVASVASSACASASGPRRSALQEKIGQHGGLSAAELRLRLYELPPRLGGMVEIAADRIRMQSADPAVRQQALLWKTDAIPTIYSATLRPDPLAGALDLWVLLYQAQDHFQQGAGKESFGPQQPIAVDAARGMVALFEATAQSLSKDPEHYSRISAQMQEFARSHPIDGTFSARETFLPEVAHLAESGDSGLIAGVGEATETLTDISLRLNAYVTLLPKVARWQAELGAQEAVGREDLHGTVDDIHSIGDMARSAGPLLADIPGAVRQASAPLGELADRQRGELLAAIDRERDRLAGFVTAEREAALAAVGVQRQAAMDGISQERAAVLSGVDAMTKRYFEDATVRARGIVDYVFVRALILVFVAAVVFALAYRFARAGRSPRATEA